MATPSAFVEQVVNRVLQAGIPLWRTYIGLQLIHPQLQAIGYMWRRGEKVQQIAAATASSSRRPISAARCRKRASKAGRCVIG